ncbi:MAG: hypothetical protein GQ581_01835 [Methyloprofundus sp.]|nr:hypothetical protein [Methyloprofundus sp.]
MLLFRTLIIFILFSFNAVAQISKEDVKQVFLDANSGNHKAQNYLGGMYYNGDGVRKNHTEAALWYGKSAKEGNIRAIISLGFLYKKGEGVNRDYAKAKELFEQALKKDPNNTRAQIGIGIMYYYGEGVTQDYAKAAEWFKYSADKKDKKGAGWFQAAKLNNKKAQGNELVKKLLTKAKLGDVNAQHDLAHYYVRYYDGNEVLDYKKAFEWYSKAAVQGDIRSIAAIGRLFYYGGGVIRNHETAKKWFVRAKKLGSQEVQGYLSLIAKEKAMRLNGTFNKSRHNKPTTLSAISTLVWLGAIVLYIILVGWHGYLRKLSIAISPTSLYLFVVYYEDWVQNNCSGECNIRIDIFITYPLLFGVVIVGVLNLVRIDYED